MTWLEIIYEILQYSLIAYFASHAYRNSQDVSDLKAKFITMRYRYDRLEADYLMARKNGFYQHEDCLESNTVSPNLTKEN